ncbi:bacteriohemerythrin [Maledivibacter halophilus]|uniref:Hemerythrin n=1 Tax=Maledivibacter halophilus TaxID=36842 RepID=A0A1T5JAS4_9FIRM|nr:bacteriohemerythrin [Maledivibacter halophilus]SKC48550.1 hemerythrin [Maledivibacter halophilus]
MFKWKDEYSCNINEIDNQHKKLLEIGLKLSNIIKDKNDLDHYDEIIEVLRELKEYTIYHFKYEEDLMHRHGYKELNGHRLTHEIFVNKIIEIENKDIDENQQKVTIEILTFIADWIENHILKVDHMYKDFLNEKGVF